MLHNKAISKFMKCSQAQKSASRVAFAQLLDTHHADVDLFLPGASDEVKKTSSQERHQLFQCAHNKRIVF